MKNRKLLLIVSLVLAMTMSLGGTLAYLTDTDADVNTMTIGHVDIVQNEQQRINDTDKQHELDKFEQDKPLLPAVFEGSSIPWAPAAEWVVADNEAWKVVEDNVNVLDKFVTVTNKGNTAAWVRTLIAYEGDATYGPNGAYIHVVHNTTNVTPAISFEDLGVVEIDGVNYTVFAYTYPEKLADKDTTIPSLKQVYMNKAATNEIVNNYGEKYDIKVISQAVQASGFKTVDEAMEAAFPYEPTVGGVKKTKAETLQGWFESIGEDIKIETPNENQDNNPPSFEANTADELIELLEKGSDATLVKGVDYGTVNIEGELNDVTIQGAEGANVRFNIMPTAVLNNVTISDINTTFVDSSSAYVDGGVFNIDAGAVVKNLVVENCDVTGSGGRSTLVGISEPSAEVTIKNTKLNGTKYMVYASAPIAQLTIEGCTVENVGSWVALMNAGDSVGAVLTINDNTFNNCNDGIAKYLGSTQPEGAATVFTNNTLTNCKGHDGSDAKWFAIPGATSTITVSGNNLDGAEWIPGIAQGLGK